MFNAVMYMKILMYGGYHPIVFYKSQLSIVDVTR